jgi:hypothetical protein
MQTIRPRIVRSGRIAAWLALAVVAGCSAASPATIDGAKLESNITADAARAGITLDAVHCPAGRVAAEHDQFSCTATLPGGATLRYDVTITSPSGAYTYALSPGQTIAGDDVAKLVTKDIASSSPALASAQVTCPASVVAPGGAATVACTLAVGATSTPITVTVASGRPITWTYATR